MPALSQAAWVFGAANAGALKAITRAKASMETRVFIVFPPVSVVQDASTILRPLWLIRCFPMSRLLGGAKKRGGRRVELRPKLFSGLRLGGPRDRPPSAADECRHSCLPGCKETGGTPRSALTISKKQFTINLGSRVQLG